MSCQLTLEFNLGHCQFNLGMTKSSSALSENQRNHQRTFHKYRSSACIVCGCTACFSCFRFAIEGVVTPSQSAVSCLSYVTQPFTAQLPDSGGFILIVQDSLLPLLKNPICFHPNFTGHSGAGSSDWELSAEGCFVLFGTNNCKTQYKALSVACNVCPQEIIKKMRDCFKAKLQKIFYLIFGWLAMVVVFQIFPSTSLFYVSTLALPLCTGWPWEIGIIC